MKNLIILVATVLLSSVAVAASNHCEKYSSKPEYTTALHVVAKEMKYSFDELCTNERIGDIYVAKKNFYDRNNEPIPHSWVSLHYWTYTCQYFVRQVDNVITQANCYNGD